MNDDSDISDFADDTDVIGEYGFDPAVSSTGDATGSASTGRPADRAPAPRSPARRGLTRRGLARGGVTRPGAAGSVHPKNRRNGISRRIGAGVVLLGALGAMGSAYAAFASSSGASDTGSSAADIAAGRQLYSTSCITCHGANLEGVKGNGPSLIGTGSSAVYFQVSTGRMPLAQQGAYAAPHPAKYNEKQTDQLGAYIESVGGGPALPVGSLRAADSKLGTGGELFRLNCASCHGTTFKGAPLSAGKVAPSLNSATDKEIYAAMQSGPESMPVFADNQLTPAQKREIVGYVQTLKASADPGGNGIDRIGPVSEAIVIWVGGVGAVMISILWIGARAR